MLRPFHVLKLFALDTDSLLEANNMRINNISDSVKHQDINLTGFSKFVQIALRKKYYFIYFQELGTYEREIILRHDVDKDLGKALDFAKYENAIGVKSTYFIMIRNPLYNIFAQKNSKILRSIIELGHDIGCHFDFNFYKDQNNKQKISNSIIEKEVDMLSWVLGRNISYVSFHQPTHNLLDEDFKIKSIESVYNKKFFKEIRYIADSMGRWRNESILDLIDGDRPPPNKIQFLSHPFWWVEKERQLRNIFANLLSYKIANLRDDLAEISNDYKKEEI